MHSLSDENTLILPAMESPLSPMPTSPQRERPWLEALKNVFPIYLATHIIFLILTYLAALFVLPNFSGTFLHLHTLLDTWLRWDSGHFAAIATGGYDLPYRTAFFPLFPLLEKGLAFVVRDPFIAGLIIANLATLGVLIMLYRLVKDDFDQELARRTVLYLAFFPTAFFLVVPYNESLFILLTLLSFYQMRRGNWWLAGLWGLLASLTRSIGICLLVPFVYEYMRQHEFKLNYVRFDVVSGLGIPAGILLFGSYCYLRFHDFLAFSHAQLAWGRTLHGPWSIFWEGLLLIMHRSILSFDSIHAVIDLSALVFVLILLILSVVGPWKLAREHWSYLLYAVVIYLFCTLFPESGRFVLASMSRFMLEIFPAFIVLARIGKNRDANLYYVTLALPLLAFMLLQWLYGGWIV